MQPHLDQAIGSLRTACFVAAVAFQSAFERGHPKRQGGRKISRWVSGVLLLMQKLQSKVAELQQMLVTTDVKVYRKCGWDYVWKRAPY